jgi:hypothetical protein
MTARHHGLQHGKEKARHPAGRPPKANTTNLQTCGRAVMAVVCGTTANGQGLSNTPAASVV